MNDRPTLLRNDTAHAHHWITIRLVGTKSNRERDRRPNSHRGRQAARQTTTVRGDGSYLSHSDTRAHFGLGDRDARGSTGDSLAERPGRNRHRAGGRSLLRRA